MEHFTITKGESIVGTGMIIRCTDGERCTTLMGVSHTRGIGARTLFTDREFSITKIQKNCRNSNS